MPQAYDLAFGSAGEVVYVIGDDDPTGQNPAEGRYVTRGTILARLDDTAYRLQLMSDNNALQQTLSNLYETVPLLPQFPEHSYNADKTSPDFGEDLGIEDSEVNYPSYYPNSTTLTSFVWAQQETARAQTLLQSGKSAEAASELYVAQSDLEACISIIEDAIHNPASGLGGLAQYADQEEASSWLWQYDISGMLFIDSLQELAEQIKQSQAALEKLRASLTEDNYADADSAFRDIASQMDGINLRLADNVNRIEKRNDTTVYGRDISFHLYDAAEEKLNAALASVGKEDLNSPDLSSNLRIAQHYIRLCNAILGSNEMVLQHGLSLQNTSNYNIDLAQKLLALDTDENNLLSAVIFAPFDGTVVSVGVKDKDIISDQDRSSRTAVTLVDTKTIKFQGLVDEIDILKIKTGQKATISVDAVPNKTFSGTISFISPSGTADTSGVVKFDVTILLDPSDVDLKGGLSATADIAIDSVNNVLIVPLTAVTTTTAGSFVTVKNPATGQPEKKQVTLGKQNQQFAEVVSGIKEGDTVIFEQKAMSGAPVTTRPQGPPPGGGR
jgi:RND family efflux transporter MFP subunit